jgi:hypothetical protein
MRNILILATLCSIATANAQNFKSKAKVAAVSTSNYYKIKLNSNIAAIAQNQFTDLRLFDDDGIEVPYLLKKDNLNTANDNYTAFEFTTVKNENGMQIITVQNPSKQALNELELRMANADADRQVSISGSNNNTDWYVVKDKFYFTNSGKDNTSEIYRVLEFPKTTYSYYKISIKNKNNDPLNIKSIGQTMRSSVENSLQTVAGFKYRIKDSSDKNTYITCYNTPENIIDKLVFKITAPDMYMRSCQLLKAAVNTGNSNPDDYDVVNSTSYKKYRKTAYQNDWNFELKSDDKGALFCNDILGYSKTDSFVIVINNKDNVPLKIETITALQLPSYAIAKLEPSKNYYLYFGDKNIETPEYDLVYFENKMPKEMATVLTGDVIDKAIKTQDEYNGNKDKYIVWIGLAIISAILIYLTTNMMKKISDEKK